MSSTPLSWAGVSQQTWNRGAASNLNPASSHVAFTVMTTHPLADRMGYSSCAILNLHAFISASSWLSLIRLTHFFGNVRSPNFSHE